MNYQKANDGQLLLLAANVGDQGAFAALYARYAGRLFAYLLPRIGQDAELAEDLRQQVFLSLLESKAFRDAETGVVQDDLSSLLFSIAANLLKNTYRSNERQARRLVVFNQLQELNTIEEDPFHLEPAKLKWALEQLTTAQRECVSLKFQRGLKIAEISEALNLPPGTVKSRLHYGLKKMQELLRAHILN